VEDLSDSCQTGNGHPLASRWLQALLALEKQKEKTGQTGNYHRAKETHWSNGKRESLNSDMADFEDAVQYVICMHNGCEVLATRNKADYGDRPNVLAPAELLERIKTAKT